MPDTRLVFGHTVEKALWLTGTSGMGETEWSDAIPCK